MMVLFTLLNVVHDQSFRESTTMSNPVYYCHSCNREVRSRDTDLKCSVCGGEFIEEIDRPNHPNLQMHLRGGGHQPQQEDAGVGGGQQQQHQAGPMDFLEQLFAGVNQAAGDMPPGVHMFGGSPHHRQRAPAPTPAEGNGQAQNNVNDNPLQQFLNNLMGNLGQDVHFRIHVNGQPPRDQAGDMPGVQFLSGNMGDYAWGPGGVDRIVTNLLNQFDGMQPQQGLSPVDIQRVPVIPVTQKHVDNGTQCTTCIDYFKLDEPVLELNCHHIFHRSCIEPWLGTHSTCPICRQEIDPSAWPTVTPSTVHPSNVPNPLDELD